jgi:hypothetical protein
MSKRKGTQCPWCREPMKWGVIGLMCTNKKCDEPQWTIRDCGCPGEHPEGHQEGCGLA